GHMMTTESLSICQSGRRSARSNILFSAQFIRLLRQRSQWFESMSRSYLALWWVPAGHIPGIDEARKRLAHLDEHGPTQFAFTFKQVFPPDEEFQRSIDWASFVPCPGI